MSLTAIYEASPAKAYGALLGGARRPPHSIRAGGAVGVVRLWRAAPVAGGRWLGPGGLGVHLREEVKVVSVILN